MRLHIIIAAILAVALFLGGCWGGSPQRPAALDSDTQNKSTTTIYNVDEKDTQYPPEASIEGKTALRYTVEGKKIYYNPELGLYFEYHKDYIVKDDDIERSMQDGVYVIGLEEASKQILKVIYTNTVTGGIRIILNKADYSLDGGRSREYLSGGRLDFNRDVITQLKERSLPVYEIIEKKYDRVIAQLHIYDHASKGLELVGYLQNQNLVFPNLAITTYLGNYFEPNLNDDWADPKLPPTTNLTQKELIEKTKGSKSYVELFNIFYSIKF